MVLRRRIQEQIPKFDLLTQRPAGKVPGAQGSALVGQENLPPRKQQEVLWKQFFADTTQWWDNRQSKLSTKHPDFRHKASKAPLWLDSPHKPVWVDLQLATVDAGVKTNPEKGCTLVAASEPFAAVEDPEVVKCRRLIDSGLLHEAVDALGRLVERGCHVSRNLFYRVLKGCIQDKDLALGRRIHALTVKSGYKGDPFLSTHLMGFYAKNGNLKDALAVFTQVPTPNAYNWSAIISAYTRQGEPAEASQAIRLYRQMCMATTVKPDVRLQAAVLKACATAKDLVAGKEVHAQIVASSGKPDRVRAGGDG